jgi:transposase
MTLADRWFCCPACGFNADRDTNAAAGCAAWAENNLLEIVAGKPPETLNGCGEGRSGAVEKPRETTLDEAVIDLAS